MAGKKVDLATLGERVKVDVPPAEPAPAASNTPAEPAAQPAATHHTSPRRETRRGAKTPAPGQWVRYDELERKETRLRIDQYGQLSDLSRRLNRLRAGQGERITETPSSGWPSICCSAASQTWQEPQNSNSVSLLVCNSSTLFVCNIGTPYVGLRH